MGQLVGETSRYEMPHNECRPGPTACRGQMGQRASRDPRESTLLSRGNGLSRPEAKAKGPNVRDL